MSRRFPPRSLFIGILAALASTGTALAQEEDTIVTDRPDFTEASSSVGRGMIQLESGYTFTHDDEADIRSSEHVLPEFLWRIGLTDEVELRIGWEGYVWVDELDKATGARDTIDGGTDMGLGFKIELTEQDSWVPESAIVPAISVPTGADSFSADIVQFELNLLYGWDLTERWSIAGSTGLGALRGAHSALLAGGPGPDIEAEVSDDFFQVHQSLTTGFGFTERLGGYYEWFAFFRDNAEDNGPEHYMNGGFTYLVTNNLQLDWRAGFGLNERSDDFFTGVGFAIRR